MLSLIRELLAELHDRGSTYCHWKSNARLEVALAGDTDLDLLVHPGSRDEFESVVGSLGFVVSQPDPGRSAAGPRYYVGLDRPTGRLIHLDVVEQILTGGALVKPYRVPLEPVIWSNLQRSGPIPVPKRHVEAALFAVRKGLEAASILEHALLERDRRAVKAEIRWLTEDPVTVEEADGLLRRTLPECPAGSVQAVLTSFEKAWLWTQRRAGVRLARALRDYRNIPTLRLFPRQLLRLVEKLLKRYHHGSADWLLAKPGPIIAFVGPKAVGKSTLLNDTHRWLRQYFRVKVVHSGRPPATLFTWPFRVSRKLLGPLLLPKGYREGLSMHSPQALLEKPSRQGIAYLIHCIMLAYEKRALFKRIERERNRGAIILSDRYPLPGIDGPRLDLDALAKSGRKWQVRLARLEKRFLGNIPAPSVVVRLHASQDVVLHRNQNRLDTKGRIDSEEMIRHQYAGQHADAKADLFLDTGGDLEDTVRDLRANLWDLLIRRGQAHSPEGGAVSAPVLTFPSGPLTARSEESEIP